MQQVEIPQNIRRAIERSRQARVAMRARRRWTVAMLGCIAGTLAGVSVLAFGGLAENGALHAAVTQAKSLADLLTQRSPGERTAAELTKTKHAKAMMKARPRIRQAAPDKPDLASAAPLLTAPPIPFETVDQVQPLAQMAVLTPPTLGTIVGPPPPPAINPPGGGGPGVVPPGQPNSPPPTVPPAVPEPATWAMMLVGFGAIGWRLRSARTEPRPRQQTARIVSR